MGAFVFRLAAILVLRAGPQDLPAGPAGLVLALLAYAATAALNLFGGSTTAARPGLTLALFVLLPVVLVWLVLQMAGRTTRYFQTAAALFGTAALLSILNLPLLAFEPGTAPAPLLAIALAVFFWHFAVDAHIWRHALEVSFGAGLALAVLLFALSYFIIATLGGLA